MDAVGECMRWAITGMAYQGEIPGQDAKCADEIGKRTIAQDLRELRVELESLRTHGSTLETVVRQKMDVMKTSVNKVESAAYDLIVRGKERPKGWVPEARDDEMPAAERG